MTYAKDAAQDSNGSPMLEVVKCHRLLLYVGSKHAVLCSMSI